MAAVNITISGVLCDKYGRTITPCTIVGSASLTGLGVGGGPIIPPDGGDKPPIPPDLGIWPNPPEGIAPHPEHPIMLPGMPGWPDVPPDMPKPPDAFDWHVAWTPTTGWVVVAIPNFDHPVPSAKKTA